MLRAALLCLPLFVAPLPGVPENPPEAPRLAVVAGPLGPGDAAALTRLAAFHGDYGGFAVLHGTERQFAKARAAGFALTEQGSWPESGVLLVARAGHLPEGGRVLHAASGQLLAVVPRGSAARLGCHEAALVPARPFAPSASFPGPQAALLADDRVAALVAAVVPANVQAGTTQLASYFTRRATSSQVLLAKDWLVAQLSAIPGVTVTTDTFSSSYGPNVIATIPGTLHPERVLVLGAHYDSINGASSTGAAPGADDNASGSAGLLEAARVLAQGEFENTIRCVWFCAEEFGLIGADADADDLQAAGTQVLAMLNMDMISYRAAGDGADLDFATNNTDPALTQLCRDVTATYVPSLPTVTGVLTAGSSDHAAYASHGFPAAFFFEDLGNSSPFIHTANDTLGNSANDFALAGDITRAFVASAATIAGPVDLLMAHAPLGDTTDAGGPYALAVDVSSLTPAAVDQVVVHWRVGQGPEQSAPLLASATPGAFVGSLPGAAPQGEVRYWLHATDTAGHEQWLPDGLSPGAKTWGFTVGTIQTVWAADFEGPGDEGWVHAQIATQDDWQRGDPAGKAGDPASAFSGASSWGNDIGPDGYNGAYQPNVDNWLESPAITTLGQTGLHLRYRRWLTVEDGFYDQARISVGGTVVWGNPVTPGGGNDLLDTDWVLHDLDVSAQADDKAAVKLRFSLQSDGGVEYGGWNLDDLRLARVLPGSVAPLTASVLHLSAAAGGSVGLALDAGAAKAGRKYLVAISASGTAPGTPLGSVSLPLVFDTATQLGFQFVNSPIFSQFFGLLDGHGRANATFNSLPGLDPIVVGLPLHFAFTTFQPFDFASNAVTVTFQP